MHEAAERRRTDPETAGKAGSADTSPRGAADPRNRRVRAAKRKPSTAPLRLSVAGGLLIASLSAALAQSPAPGMAAMRAADRQAGLAAAAARLEDVRAYLQQALNCLAGTGAARRAPVNGPCSGPGALQQLPAGSANHVRVQKAIRLATVGVTFHDFAPAHFTAQAVKAVLDEGAR